MTLAAVRPGAGASRSRCRRAASTSRSRPRARRTRLDVDVRLKAGAKVFPGPVKVANAEPGPLGQATPAVHDPRQRASRSRPSASTSPTSTCVLDGGGRASGRAMLQKSGVQAELRVADVNLAALHGRCRRRASSGRVAVEGDRQAQRFDLALKDPRFDIEARAALGDDTARGAVGAGAHRRRRGDRQGQPGARGSEGIPLRGPRRAFRPVGVREDHQGRPQLRLRGARRARRRYRRRGEARHRAEHLCGAAGFGARQRERATSAAWPPPMST